MTSHTPTDEHHKYGLKYFKKATHRCKILHTKATQKRNHHRYNTPTFTLSIPAKTLTLTQTSTSKPISTLKQAFEVVRIFQNGTIVQKCPHFTSRMRILLLNTDSHTQRTAGEGTQGEDERGEGCPLTLTLTADMLGVYLGIFQSQPEITGA